MDLDGVCGDYTTSFRAVVAEDRGVDPSSLGDARSWDFAEWGITGPDEFDRLHRLAVLEHRMFRHMPPLPGVAESLWRLSDAGVWIRIITHRLCVNWGHAVAERHDGHAPNQDRGFVEAVASGQPGPHPDLQTALRAHVVVDGVYRSAAAGGAPVDVTPRGGSPAG